MFYQNKVFADYTLRRNMKTVSFSFPFYVNENSRVFKTIGSVFRFPKNEHVNEILEIVL